MEFDPTEWEVYTQEPEAMCVGKLNNVVRELREALYQERLRKQELREALANARVFTTPVMRRRFKNDSLMIEVMDSIADALARKP